MDQSSQERRLLAWAVEEGFDRAGIASLGPSEHADALAAWLRRGDQAGMAWLGRRPELRADSRLVLEGARSAICVALQYHPLAGSGEPTGDLWPRVARYSRGDDYHLVMERRLRRLGERVEAALPGSLTRTYVDTGPVLERELAARAGLGTIGKNTNLLHPEAGSWFLLGELLTTLDLESSAGFEDLCGSCTACLDACPTGALPEAYRLDSRRCISYWTIEHRGAIPAELRDEFGGWVFGCDVCQEVCPVNETAVPGTEPRLELPAHRAAIDLETLAEMSHLEYVERFRHSAMKRAKLPGLQRNAVLAMGQRRDPRYLEVLVRLVCAHEETTVRSHAAWSLGRIGGVAARQALIKASSREDDPVVQGEIESALEGLAAESDP